MGKPISEEVGKRAPEGGVSDWLVDKRMMGLSGLLPWDPIRDLSSPVEGCPSMGEERDVTEGVRVQALVNVGLVLLTACIASSIEPYGTG